MFLFCSTKRKHNDSRLSVLKSNDPSDILFLAAIFKTRKVQLNGKVYCRPIAQQLGGASFEGRKSNATYYCALCYLQTTRATCDASAALRRAQGRRVTVGGAMPIRRGASHLRRGRADRPAARERALARWRRRRPPARGRNTRRRSPARRRRPLRRPPPHRRRTSLPAPPSAEPPNADRILHTHRCHKSF